MGIEEKEAADALDKSGKKEEDAASKDVTEGKKGSDEEKTRGLEGNTSEVTSEEIVNKFNEHGAGLSDVQKKILKEEIIPKEPIKYKVPKDTTKPVEETVEESFTKEPKRYKVPEDNTIEVPFTEGLKRYPVPEDITVVVPEIVVTPEKIKDVIAANSAMYGFPIGLIPAVITVESAWQPEVVSSAGAVGYMQIMPTTAKDMGDGDIKDPIVNITYGADYMAKVRDIMIKADKTPLLDWTLAGYNAGPYKVRTWTSIPEKIYKDYIDKVKTEMDRLRRENI